MNQPTRLEALSVFLKTQREKLSPEDVGLPAGGRRRTPGLRREEVAALAGVSTTWYTWLEQGRDIRVSSAVLDAIARTLRLTKDERNYMFALALETETAEPPQTQTVQLSPALTKILQELTLCPAIVSDRRSQIVGWNTAAEVVFLPFADVPVEQRNMIELLFSRKELRRLAVNWERFVLGFLSIFRAFYGQYVNDAWYNTFIDHMKRQYPDFEALWSSSRVDTAPEVVLEFRHSRGGKMLFELTSLQIQGSDDLRVSIYTPAAGSSTEAKLRKLMGAAQQATRI
ncbi:helix-turn-helix transcriptional regulator [Paenibacillus chartarius]|uniref:Helix-turn-helix transcriptional regulator n=1 Tax=Paenibacillus chartarius TaxID=747481 RepID=A0ABV6DI60_9BACL